MSLLPNIKIFTIGAYFFLNVYLNSALPFHSRIIGGEIAKPGQFPYIVSIQITLDIVNYQGHLCGASIFNDQWIVTAAHCIMSTNVEDYEIIAGTNLLDTGGVKYNVSKYVMHPDFDINVIWDDIALIKIVGEFDFSNPLIKSIKIGEVSGNESSTAVGWGGTEETDYPNDLHFLQVTALSPGDCTRLAEGSQWTDILPRGPGHVCAFAAKGKSVCHGDSGSPLVYNNTVVGIVSYALDNTCAMGYPDVYTRIAYYKDWIETTIAEN